jgi:hypothetical protein
VKTSQNPPHDAAQWQQSEQLWQEGISRLEEVPVNDPGYLEAQKMLATYKKNLGDTQLRRQAEETSVRALEEAQIQIQSLQANTPTQMTPEVRNPIISKLQGIINQLEKVKPGTTAYPEAQDLLKSAKAKLKQL